jgi:antitoxin (DNA-binding transcriptional repressor) of toxin-antitoxin stability system
MVLTLTPAEAVQKLEELLPAMRAGDEITVSSGSGPVTKIVLSEAKAKPRRRQGGSAKGTLHIIKEDDEHLQDFKDYM